MNRFLVAIFCSLIASSLSGQGHQELVHSMERQIPSWLKWYGVPGIAIAVIEDRDLVYEAPFGVSNQQTQAKLSAEDQFPLGALSELLSVFATLELVRSGKLDLEASLNTRLQSWELESTRFETGECLLEQLLSHSSGINAPNFNAKLQTDSLSMIRILNGQASGGRPAQLNSRPGTRFQPSWFNGALLDVLVEDAYGISMQEYLQRIVMPDLGMGYSGFLGEVADRKSLVPAYHVLQGEQIPEPALVPIADGLFSNLDDYASFVQAFLRTLKADTTALQRLFMQPQIKTNRSYQWIANHYALGAYWERIGDSTVLLTQIGEYAGGYHCRVLMDPEAGRALLVFSNSLSGRPIVNRLVAMWSRYYYDRIPKMNRSFQVFYRLSSFLSVFLILISIGVFYHLYRTRAQRMFGLIRKSAWQIPCLLAWVSLLFGLLYAGLPYITYWIPQQFLLVNLAIFVYLLSLLLWILNPRILG